MYKTKFWITVVVIGFILYSLARVIWPFPVGTSDNTAYFFNLVTALESVFTGIGIAFVGFGLKEFKLKSWQVFDWLAFTSIAWILISGYPHDNFHIIAEPHLEKLISLEIFFHGTLAVAAIIVMHEFVRKQNKFR